MERAYERTLGTVLVAIGVGILLFGFYQAYELGREIPSATPPQPPTAAFTWTSSGANTAQFTDMSKPGTYSIVTTYWNFGDGNTSSMPNATHVYGRAGTYNVTLMVQDSAGTVMQSSSPVTVAATGSYSGAGSPSTAGGNNSINSILAPLDLAGKLAGLVHVVETFVVIILELLIGGAILRAGWNLITPKAETIQVRVKPKSLQVEPVGFSVPPASSPSPSVGSPAGAGFAGSSPPGSPPGTAP